MSATLEEMATAFVAQVTAHAGHEQRQVGRCVYCDTCGVRIGQGHAAKHPGYQVRLVDGFVAWLGDDRITADIVAERHPGAVVETQGTTPTQPGPGTQEKGKAMTAPTFAQPSGGDWFKPADHNGHLLLILRVHGIEKHEDKLKAGEVDKVTMDLVDLNETNAQVRDFVLDTHPGIVNKLGKAARTGEMVLGRLTQVPSEKGNPAWVLGAYQVGTDDAYAAQWLAANPQAQFAQPAAPTTTAPDQWQASTPAAVAAAPVALAPPAPVAPVAAPAPVAPVTQLPVAPPAPVAAPAGDPIQVLVDAGQITPEVAALMRQLGTAPAAAAG